MKEYMTWLIKNNCTQGRFCFHVYSVNITKLRHKENKNEDLIISYMLRIPIWASLYMLPTDNDVIEIVLNFSKI